MLNLNNFFVIPTKEESLRFFTILRSVQNDKTQIITENK